MLYCEKCSALSPDGAGRCQSCRSPTLRPVAPEDLVLLHRADQYTATLLAEKLAAENIPYALTPASRHPFTQLYDSEALPTDKAILVAYASLSRAEELSLEVKAQVEAEQAAAGEGEGGGESPPMSRRKRLVVQVLSTIAFLILVMLVVFGADAFSNWLKSLFGL